LEVSATVVAVPRPKSTGAVAESALDSDRATLGEATNEVSQHPVHECVRWGKVAAIRAALAAGTYFVPAEAVASKLVESMLSPGQSAIARADNSTNIRRR
jgi:anti-sigma28 factor (negative regulator of flagellin synthesis)